MLLLIRLCTGITKPLKIVVSTLFSLSLRFHAASNFQLELSWVNNWQKSKQNATGSRAITP